ncbi:hypothetical protein ECANGB1_971 [Enterospora canceri]|uniref:Uncharacterized protein n=1 Tax=Enterospora canceri TaxID=1081671 RepID=A0A1Y1S749_9MICR|nr:hypothetical protein ECANGB1_971 [Enterospora canceri]
MRQGNTKAKGQKRAQDEESARIHLFMAAVDEKIHSPQFVEEIHAKFIAARNTTGGCNESESLSTHRSLCIRKLHKYIDYFLSAGPFTESEHALFTRTVELMNGYYHEMINSRRSDIVYPARNTPVYSLFFNRGMKIKNILLTRRQK